MRLSVESGCLSSEFADSSRPDLLSLRLNFRSLAGSKAFFLPNRRRLKASYVKPTYAFVARSRKRFPRLILSFLEAFRGAFSDYLDNMCIKGVIYEGSP
jgi:hypothetical protein